MAESGQNCSVDSDCAGLHICYYAEFPWVKGEENICGCNSWFGYKGPDCDEWDVGAYVDLLSLLVSASIGLVGCYICIKTLLFQFKIVSRKTTRRKSSMPGKSSMITPGTEMDPSATGGAHPSESQPPPSATSKDTRSKLNVVSCTTMLSFLGMIFYVCWRIAMIVLLATPENTVLRDESGIDGKAKAHFIEEKVEPYLVVVSGVFICIAMMNLSLVWIHNVKKIKQFSRQEHEQAVKYKWFLMFLNVVWIVLFFALDPAQAGAIVIGFMILISISYYLAELYLKHLHQVLYLKYPSHEMIFGDYNQGFSARYGNTQLTMNRQKRSEWLVILLRRMIKTRRWIVVASMISIFGAALYLGLSIQTSWREHSEVGRVSFAMVGNEFMILGIGMANLAIIVFLYISTAYPLSGRSTDI